jgi:hypothetical protein
MPVIFEVSMRAIALALGLSMLVVGCSKRPFPAPDPEGHDIKQGSIVVALEKNGGYRIYKVQHVDDYPKPIGWEYHMLVYEPKASSFEEARDLWESKKVKVLLDHIDVRAVHFLPRDHRIVDQETVTDEEMAPYKKSINRSPGP